MKCHPSNLQLTTLLPLVFASIITFSTSVALADAKNEVIDKQQEMTQTEMDAAKVTNPADEKRPAATTSQDKHSTESPKGDMIKKQQKATEQGIKDAEAAKPKVDKKPATNSYHY